MIDTSENEVTTKGTFLCARKLNKKKKKASFRSSYGKGDHLFNSVTPWCSVQTDSSDPPPLPRFRQLLYPPPPSVNGRAELVVNLTASLFLPPFFSCRRSGGGPDVRGGGLVLPTC